LTRRALSSEVALIGCFLLIIFGVPVTQICLQLRLGQRVQFLDAFRYAPTERNLREFEQGLKDESWFEQTLRPLVQQFLFRTVGDTGSKAVMGLDGWLFYLPDVRYVLEPDRLDASGSEGKWLQQPEGTYQDSVVTAIVRFRDQLEERHIQLLVMPVPGKPSICPEMSWRTAGEAGKVLASPTLSLIDKLNRKGVEVVDLFSRFRQLREKNSKTRLYLAQDTHWTPEGARLAAESVAEKLRALAWAPPPTVELRSTKVRVKRYGDILEMIQSRHSQRNLPGEEVEDDQVVDNAGRLLTSSQAERSGTYRYPGGAASILVLGDSFCRIYQEREPRSLGEIVSPPGEASSGNSRLDAAPTRLIPGSAGFPSYLALALQAPLDFIVSDGGASTDVRRTLATDPEILEGKKVVIWEFVERDIQLGKAGWLDVTLPPALGALRSPPSPQERGPLATFLFNPLLRGEGGPLPALLPAGAGRVRGHF